MAIFFDTSTPPASSATFQLRPQSSRRITAVPENAALELPHGSSTIPLKSKSMVTGLVTSLMVRAPVNFHDLPSGSTAVETKRISGKVSTSKKSADLIWPSRSSSPVDTEAVSMSIPTLESCGLSATSIVPVTAPKPPRTLVTIR